MGREANAALWRQRVEEFERSRLSLRAWCARTGWAVSTLDAWRRRLRDAPAQKSMPEAAATLVPIVVAPPTGRAVAAASIEVEANGFRVHVPADTDPAWVCAVLLGLRP
jgi:hypothetical protein